MGFFCLMHLCFSLADTNRSMRLRHPGSFFLLLLSLSLTSCSRSAVREFSTEMQTATSWAATAQMAGEAWVRRAVPTHYAGRTIETAVETLSETRQTLEQSSSIPPDQRVKAREHLQNLAATIEEMRKAIRSGDRARVQEQVEQLAAQKQALLNFLENAGARP